MYTLNYNTGAGNTHHKTLEECFKSVNPAYTQKSIDIVDPDGNILYTSRWYGVPADPENDVDLKHSSRVL